MAAEATLGQTYCNPASHGEGRFVAPKEWLDKLFANGQVATQYVNEAGQPTMDEEWNVNGSYMQPSKESQVRMAVCLERWHTPSAAATACSHEHLR